MKLCRMAGVAGAAALCGLTAVVLPAAEVTYGFAYNGVNYTTKVWWSDSLAVGQIQGVIVHFNYAAGANLYTNPNWQTFATARKLAMVLHISQDSFLTAADGLTILQNTLNYAAAQSGHTELAASGLPYMFTGVSRGGTLGAINLGWNAGGNKTIACIAYHGASFQYVPTVGAAARAIPVLYPIAQLDDPTQGRQAMIEAAVRTDSTSFSGPRRCSTVTPTTPQATTPIHCNGWDGSLISATTRRRLES
jgi:hypothetical protein